MPLQLFIFFFYSTTTRLQFILQISCAEFVGRMSCQLTLASRANQAELLPVLLVATSINEARPSPVIAITYEDTALLHEGEKAVVQFTGASGTPVYGTEKAIQELRANFPFLNSKDEKIVSHASPSLNSAFV